MPAPVALLLIALAVFWAPPAIDFVLSLARRMGLRPAAGGNPRAGLVVYVEPLRAFGIRWGHRSLSVGLRRAGFAGEIRYWAWQSAWHGWLCLPAILDRKMLRRRSRELAEFLGQQCAAEGARRVYVIGYSAGGLVAARALELLPDGVQVDGAALLAPAVDPRRDLAPAAGHVRGGLVVVSSLLDYTGVGLGTLVTGTSDGRRTPSMGMLGVCGPRPANVIEIRWRPGMLRLGHWGGHMSATEPRFVAECLAPAMGIGKGTAGHAEIAEPEASP